MRDPRTSPQLLLRLAAIAGMLLLCAYLAPRTSSRLLLLLAAGLGGLALVGRLQLGLVLLIPASMVVPFALETGSQTEISVTLLLLAALLALWILDMVRRRELRLAPSPANLPFILLIAVAGLSIVVGDALWNPLVQTKGNFELVQLAQWSVFIFSAGVFWLTANLVHDVRWLRSMVAAFLGLGGLYIALRLVSGSPTAALRIFTAGSGGSLFWVWLVALAGGQVLFNRGLRRSWRLALGLLVGATFFVAWFQGRTWVSGWAPPVAAMLVLVWLRSASFGALITIALGLGIQVAYPYFYANVVLTALQTGSFLRLPAWRGILQLVGRRWPLGLGLAAYWHYWRDVIGTWEWSATNVVRLTADAGVNSHSNYVDLYAQMGVLGLGVFLWLAAALWKQGWRLRKTMPDGFERGYIYGCLGGLAGTLAAGFLADWFLPFVYNVGLAGMRASVLGWLFLGGMVSLQWMVRRGGDGTQAA